MLLVTDNPSLADTPINPILWAVIGFLATIIITLSIVVINVIKNQFVHLVNRFEKFESVMDTKFSKFESEILEVKNDIKDLQHGQEMFSKDLQIKDMKIDLIHAKNKVER